MQTVNNYYVLYEYNLCVQSNRVLEERERGETEGKREREKHIDRQTDRARKNIVNAYSLYIFISTKMNILYIVLLL